MKVTIIHGQSHKGASYNICRSFVNQLKDVQQFSEYFLPRDMSAICIGCFQCLVGSESCCPHYDSIKAITKCIDDSDLLVFSTPVYCMGTTASMKALLEHYFSRWMNHKPKSAMFYKKAVVIAIGAGGGMRKASKDIVTNLRNWGISDINVFCKSSYAMRWDDVNGKRKDRILKDIKRLANRVELKKYKYPVSIGRKFHFQCMRLMHRMNWGMPEDKRYWELEGWLGQQRPWENGSCLQTK